MLLLLPGLVVGVLSIILSILLNKSDVVMYSLFIIGFIPIIISGFMTGAYVTGDRVRGNYSDIKEFNERIGVSPKLFLFGIPFMLAAKAIHFITWRVWSVLSGDFLHDIMYRLVNICRIMRRKDSNLGNINIVICYSTS